MGCLTHSSPGVTMPMQLCPPPFQGQRDDPQAIRREAHGAIACKSITTLHDNLSLFWDFETIPPPPRCPPHTMTAPCQLVFREARQHGFLLPEFPCGNPREWPGRCHEDTCWDNLKELKAVALQRQMLSLTSDHLTLRHVLAWDGPLEVEGHIRIYSPWEARHEVEQCNSPKVTSLDLKDPTRWC